MKPLSLTVFSIASFWIVAGAFASANEIPAGVCKDGANDAGKTMVKLYRDDEGASSLSFADKYPAPIRVSDYSGCLGCRCVSYFGPLLAGCNDACTIQGYQAVVDAAGKVIGFRKNTFQRWDGNDGHTPLTKQEVDRLIEIANCPSCLEEVYAKGLTSSDPTGYAARISKSSALSSDFYRAGNTVASFLLQMSRVRGIMGVKSFPLYKGKTPMPSDSLLNVPHEPDNPKRRDEKQSTTDPAI